MKLKILLCLALAPLFLDSSSSQEISGDLPVTGDDLVDILELDIQKHGVKFDEPEYVTLHFESRFQNQTWTLPEPQSEVSILIYYPKKEKSDQAEGIAEMTLRLKGESHGHTILSYGSYDDIVKTITTSYQGKFEIVAKESKESEDFVYRLYLTTSKEAPKP